MVYMVEGGGVNCEFIAVYEAEHTRPLAGL